MTEAPILQTTIWGTDVALEARIEPAKSLRVRPTFRPAPLFDAAPSGALLLAGIPASVRKAFQAASRAHAKDHPKARPLSFHAFLRASAAAPTNRPVGRPTERPAHIDDKASWAAYQRAKTRASNRTNPVEFPSFEDWIVASEVWRECGRRGGIAARGSMRQEVRWVVVIPRRELIKNPEIEREWHKKLHNDATLSKTHRIVLRGVQRRVS